MPEKGFFASLFDISFSSLITTKVIKFVYVLTLVVIGVAALFFVGAAFVNSAAYGVLTLLIIAPLMSLIYVVYTRVLLEFIIAVFRIMEYQRDSLALAQQQAQLHTPAPVAVSSPASPPASSPPSSAPPAGPLT